MRNNFLLCLVLVCLVTNYSECKGGRSGSRSSSRSSSSSSSRRGGGWFSGSRSKPSSSSSSSHSYPSSFSGLSGSGSSSYNYPKLPIFGYPSSTGLSGSSSSSNKFPSFSYPSSTGLSGSGSSSNKFPSFSYPSSTGLSGSGSSSNKFPSFGYPSSTGLSGSGIRNPSNYYPTSYTNSRPSNPYHSTNTYNTNSGNPYKTPGYGYQNQNTYYNPPRYYSAPQHVYITEYRNSDSRYSDLLSGLALYNLGRSHNNIHDRYYYDDFYRRRYHSSESSYLPNNKPEDEARCMLRIKQNGKIEELQIPCEIVSTFTDGSQKLSQDTVSQTVCLTNYTVINNTLSLTTTIAPISVPDNFSSTTVTSKLPKDNTSPAENGSITSSTIAVTLSNSTVQFNSSLNSNTSIFNTIVTPLIESTNFTNSSLHLDKENALNSNATIFLNSESSSINNGSNIFAIPVEVNETNIELLTTTPNTIITTQITTISNTTIYNTTVTSLKESNDFTNSSVLLDKEITFNSNATSFSSEFSSIGNISVIHSDEANVTNSELLTTTPKTNITSQINTISDTTMFDTTVTSLKQSNNFTNSPLLLNTEIALNSNATTTVFLNSSSTPSSNISAIPSVEVNKTNIELSTTTQKTIITSQITTMNATNCTVTNDPLSVKGPQIKASDMECEVDIVTKDSHFRNKVNCKTLMEYAKMPEPKKESSSSILPSRSKLKSWISNPPWWLSIFIAV